MVVFSFSWYQRRWTQRFHKSPATCLLLMLVVCWHVPCGKCCGKAGQQSGVLKQPPFEQLHGALNAGFRPQLHSGLHPHFQILHAALGKTFYIWLPVEKRILIFAEVRGPSFQQKGVPLIHPSLCACLLTPLWGLPFFHALRQWRTVPWGISFVRVWTTFCSWPSAHPILSDEVKSTASLSDEASRKPTVGTGIRSPVTFAEYSLSALSSSVSFSGARLCFPASKCACKAEDRWKDLTRYSWGQQNKPLAKVIYLFVSLVILLLNIFRVLLGLFCTVRGLVRCWGFFLVYCVTDGSRAIFGMGRTRLMPRRCKQYAYSCSAGTDVFLLELTRTAS